MVKPSPLINVIAQMYSGWNHISIAQTPAVPNEATPTLYQSNGKHTIHSAHTPVKLIATIAVVVIISSSAAMPITLRKAYTIATDRNIPSPPGNVLRSVFTKNLPLISFLLGLSASKNEAMPMTNKFTADKLLGRNGKLTPRHNVRIVTSTVMIVFIRNNDELF